MKEDQINEPESHLGNDEPKNTFWNQNGNTINKTEGTNATSSQEKTQTLIQSKADAELSL